VPETPQGLTVILGRARDGDERARDELIALIYDELRRVASRLMRRERPEERKAGQSGKRDRSAIGNPASCPARVTGKTGIPIMHQLGASAQRPRWLR
jgi:ECF sigma factor